MKQREHIGRTTNVDVRVDTSTQPHTTELGRLYDNDVTERTAGVESFPLTVVLYQCRTAAAAAAAITGHLRRCHTNTSENAEKVKR